MTLTEQIYATLGVFGILGYVFVTSMADRIQDFYFGSLVVLLTIHTLCVIWRIYG